jgi:hypothetical protein
MPLITLVPHDDELAINTDHIVSVNYSKVAEEIRITMATEETYRFDGPAVHAIWSKICYISNLQGLALKRATGQHANPKITDALVKWHSPER